MAATTEATPATYPFALTTTVANPGTHFTLYSEDPVRLPYSVDLGATDPIPLPTPFVVTQVPFSVPAFNFVDSAPRFTAFEQFTLDPNTQVQPNLAVSNGGITLGLRNLQDGNSFTVGAGKPAGSNITYAFDNVYTSGGVPVRQTYLGTARFDNGWRAVFHSEDRLLGLPFGQQKSEVNLRFVPPQAGAVSINDFVALPATFNPEINETTTFQAGFVATGFGNATLNWTLTPSGPPTTATVLARTASAATGGGGGGTEIPPTFNGSADITSGVANVTQLWDGKSSTGQALALGEYPYALNVTVVDQDNGSSQSATANATVSLSGDPILVVEDSGNILATSEDQVSQPNPAGVERLLSVYPFKRSGQSSPLTIRVSSLANAGDGDITVTLNGSLTGKPKDVILSKVSEGTYENKQVLLDAVVVQDSTLSKKVATSYAIGDAVSVSETYGKQFQSLLGTIAANTLYPTVRAPFGRFTAFKTFENQPKPPDDLAQASPENLRNFGFEAVTITLKSPAPPKPLNALLKVRHSASTFYLVGHGDHGGAIGTPTPSNPKAGLDNSLVLPADTSQLKTLILGSCNVLDMHDYNNNYPGATDLRGQPLDGNRQSAADPISKRFSPGRDWWNTTRRQDGVETVLLGYNFPVPGITVAGAFAQYDAVFPQVQASPSARGRLEAATWLVAHAAYARGNQLGLGACAWDKTGYYFISTHPPLRPAHQIQQPVVRTIDGYFRVPLDASGENINVTPTSPPVGGNVERLVLP